MGIPDLSGILTRGNTRSTVDSITMGNTAHIIGVYQSMPYGPHTSVRVPGYNV